VRRIQAHPSLRLAAVCTHLAVADQTGNPATTEQLARFDEALRSLAADGLDVPRVHAANSAATIAHPDARRSFVRAGIAVYGIPPSPALAAASTGLTPALSFKARVSLVKVVAAGERVSYGLCHTFPEDTVVATVPVGYADGVPRRLFGTGGEVLIGGRRRPIVGVVTMDQLMVACGPAPAFGGPDDAGERGVRVGDEVVLLGRQGGERITADEWADRLGTISYEVVCGISARVPRYHVGPEGLGGTSEGGR
jgi:alanine racemase